MWNEGAGPGGPDGGFDPDPADFGWDPATPEGPWPQYAALLRQLDVVRAIEQSRTDGIRAGVAQMSEHADTLGDYLAEQREMLMELTRNLRYKMPEWTPIPPDADAPEGWVPPAEDGRAGSRSQDDPEHEEFDADPSPGPAAERIEARDEHNGHDGPQEHHPAVPLPPPVDRPRPNRVEPATALGEVARLIDRGNVAADRADELGAAPALLPHWSARSRNILIYGLCAALTVLLQAQLLILKGSQLLIWIVIPAALFGVGYFMIRDVGSPRIGRRSRNRSVKTGLALCFLIGPVCQLLFGLGR